MEERVTFWDRLSDYPLWRLIAGVFLYALAARLVVTLVFFLRWGWHTVSGIELWFYYGVAEGTFQLYSIWDPTWWILSLIGAVFSGEALLYATYLTSSVWSSLNAALFCLFVSELHGKKTGLMAGLIYGTMVLPMFNSAGTTTHDIYAYAWLVLALYGTLMVFRRKGWVRLPFAALALVSLWLGAHVGPTIMVSAGTLLLYLLWRLVKDRHYLDYLLVLKKYAVFKGRASCKELWGYSVCSLIILSVLIASKYAFGWSVIPAVLYGSAVIIPSIAVSIRRLHDINRSGWWMLISLIPLGFIVLLVFFLMESQPGGNRYGQNPGDYNHGSAGRNNGYLFFIISLAVIIGVLLLAKYFLMPPLMEKIFDLALESRGIDVRAQIRAGSGDLLASSLGDYWLRFNFLFFFLPVGVYIAVKKKDMLGLLLLMTGYLASRTADRGTRPLSFGFALMGALAFLNWRPAYGWILAAWMTYIIGEFGGKYSTEYAVFFPVCALFIYYSLQWPSAERRSGAALAVFLFSIFAILVGFVLLSGSDLREAWGIFTVPLVPGGLLRTALGFTYLFILFAVATVAIIVYTVYDWIARSHRPGWIGAVFALTALWLLIAAILGGAMFRVKELGKPDSLRTLEGLDRLPPAGQVEAVNSVLSRINELMTLIQRDWTIQVCLLAAGLLMVLLAATRPRGEGRERRHFFSLLRIIALAGVPLLGLLLLILGPEGFWKNLRFIAPPVFGVLVYVFYRPREAGMVRSYPAGAALVCWLFAAVIPSMNQTAKSSEGEYRLYRWLGEHTGGEGRIFVPWSDGYMAEAVSGVKSELSPENIDFQLPRLYWMTEEAAALALRSRSIDYIVISSKYFMLLRHNPETGEFQYSFSPDIIYQPQQLGINTMDRLRETALFKMLYRTRELEHFQLLHFERDPAVNETSLIFGVRAEK